MNFINKRANELFEAGLISKEERKMHADMAWLYDQVTEQLHEEDRKIRELELALIDAKAERKRLLKGRSIILKNIPNIGK